MALSGKGGDGGNTKRTLPFIRSEATNLPLIIPISRRDSPFLLAAGLATLMNAPYAIRHGIEKAVFTIGIKPRELSVGIDL